MKNRLSLFFQTLTPKELVVVGQLIYYAIWITVMVWFNLPLGDTSALVPDYVDTPTVPESTKAPSTYEPPAAPPKQNLPAERAPRRYNSWDYPPKRFDEFRPFDPEVWKQWSRWLSPGNAHPPIAGNRVPVQEAIANIPAPAQEAAAAVQHQNPLHYGPDGQLLDPEHIANNSPD